MEEVRSYSRGDWNGASPYFHADLISLVMNLVVLYCGIPADVDVMFEDTIYSVSESEGSVEVCVERDEQVILDRPVSVSINTMAVSATLNDDFISTNAMLTFTSAGSNRQCTDIVIEMDSVVESQEVFAVNLVGVDEAARVVTPTVDVVIEDASTLRAMFQSSTPQVTEGGSVDVCVELLDPITRSVQVSLLVEGSDGMLVMKLHQGLWRGVMVC